jgi:hypothetical protein
MADFLMAVATTVELLPERFDLPGVVLTLSGLGALVGASGALLAGRSDRAKHAEVGALSGALAAVALFVGMYVAQEVG